MHLDYGGSRIFSACEKTLFERLIVKILSDKNHFALTSLACLPWMFRGAEVDLLVHSLKYEFHVPLGGIILRTIARRKVPSTPHLILEGKDALRTVQILRLLGKKRRHKLVIKRHIKKTIDCETDGGYERQVMLLLLSRCFLVVMRLWNTHL